MMMQIERMHARILAVTAITVLTVFATQNRPLAQAPPNMTGAWAPMQGGRGADPKTAPPAATPLVLKAPYKAKYDAQRAADAEATKRGEPPASAAVLCNPYGMPRMLSIASYPIEILQTPGQVTIITEAFSEVRRVYMDQPQMPIDEVPPGYYGHSVGRWEKDTLVVDTVGIKETVPGYQNMPHSDQMRITERIRLVTPDVMHIQVTIDDPVVLEKPVTFTYGYRRMPGYKMVEFVCENNREYIDAEGKVRMRLGAGSAK
jgi:hypothetical protein